ncbi:hypothetical protein K439DRAFT_1626022 [Ramaria rubella]|nr:hypothetical protein K439DRAFT_1626022 [Ramaria rubella]
MSTLPFQVEELISTLNSTNIGTEALELAKLQAQLQQALQGYPQGAPFPTSPVQTAYSHNGGVPANTPTARTPSWGQYSDPAHTRRRRSSSAASLASATSRPRRQAIREQEEDLWRQSEATRSEAEQDVMEDVEEEAQVDASLYATPSPIQFTHHSPTYGSSPSAYTDPFLAQQLQAVEQRSRQPSFFAQIATAQQHTSPFYAAHQSQPQLASSYVQFESQTSQSQPALFSQGRPARHHLTIDTGLQPFPVDVVRMR